MRLSQLCLRAAVLNLGLQRYASNGQLGDDGALDFHRELDLLAAQADDLGEMAEGSDAAMVRDSLLTVVDEARGYLAKLGFTRPS